MAKPLLELQDLSKYYVNGRNVVAGLNGINISFDRGEFVAITGESGSGKSTLAHILCGILPYEDGEFYINGKPTSHYDSADWERYRAENVGFISQSYGILPGSTVMENVVSALRLTGMEKEQATEEAQRILEEVELWPMRSRRAAKLSSGQKQRLSIARALAKPCDLLIADEPTGNLDPENSDKVIQLLKKASKDRLVVLITHEFSEAENYVTRHVSLQGGKISSDARLQPYSAGEQTRVRTKAKKDLSAYTASLQMRSRPAWSTIVLLFLTLTAFAVFAFLGTFIVALDDTSTRLYDSDAFLNGDKNRIVAIRQDGQNMTQENYDTILSMKYVTQLEQYGYITDICYAYREGEDYITNYSTREYTTGFDRGTIDVPVIEILSTEQFMKTVPMYADETDFLTAGQLPQQYGQVVAVGGEELIGQQYTVYVRNDAVWDDGGYIAVDVTVVGVTDEGDGLYFSAELARVLTASYLGDGYTYIPFYEDIPSEGTYINYRNTRSVMMYGPFCDPFYAELEPGRGSTMGPMEDTEAYVSLKEYVAVLSGNPEADYQDIYDADYAAGDETWHIAGIHESTLQTVLAVSPDSFQRILNENGVEDGDQVSITIKDYAYAERVIANLEKAGYIAVSPYILGATTIVASLAAQRMQTLYVCIGALLAILLLQMIVLRALFGMENDSYRVLSDMGLTCRTAKRSVFWQLLLFTLVGQILGIAGIMVCSAAGVERIMNLTKYLYGGWWFGISVVHLMSTMLAAWYISAGLKKRVYPSTARRSDLPMDDEEVAV